VDFADDWINAMIERSPAACLTSSLLILFCGDSFFHQ